MDFLSEAKRASTKQLSLEKQAPTKLEFNRKDSGYISPITPASAASSTGGPVIRRSLSGARVNKSGESSPEVEQTSPEPVKDQEQMSLLGINVLQMAVGGSTSPQDQASFEPKQPTEYLQRVGSPLSNSINSEDRILLAFKCKGSHTDWSNCTHPYCFKVRGLWIKFRKCCATLYNSCLECKKYCEMVIAHSKDCSDYSCPVNMCNDAKHLQQDIEDRKMSRAHSSDDLTPVTDFKGFLSFPASGHYQHNVNNFYSLGSYGSLGGSSGPVTMEMIEQRAAEIVDRMDQEEPLISSKPPPSLSGRPRSLPPQQEEQKNIVGNTLSPIVEHPGDTSDILSFESNVSLILRSNQFSGAFSSLGDGPGDSGLDQSMNAGVSQPPSMAAGSQPSANAREQPAAKVVYPSQTLQHRLDREFLTPGQDGYYYQHRDYYLNDVDSLGSGGFGTCMYGKDNKSEQQFAMKRNKENCPKLIDSMRAECFVLSKLRPHHNVIRFLGAVIDKEENNFFLPNVYKMFMELADCGNLAEMLITEDDIKEPLPLDQSLYYIEQVLQGVAYLHQNSVLHLDIKAVNVLVFHGGRTVKLADFGTAVQLSEISAVGGKITGCTPYFAAPEVVKQDQPGFSADVWSVMCVLVELLTTKWPGCHEVESTHQQMIYQVGNYCDEDIELMIPLSTLSLDPEIEQLFRTVFVVDCSKRPAALTLLNECPKIRNAPEYEREFDAQAQYEEMSQEISEPQATPYASLAQSYIPPVDHIQTAATFNPTPQFYPPQLTEASAYPPIQQSYPSSCESADLERDFPPKKFSCDSGQGDDMEGSLTSRGYPMRSATGSSSGGRPDYRKMDSGVDTFSPMSSEDYHSFPFKAHRDNPQFKRSSSVTGTRYSSKTFDSNTPTPKLVPSTHRLYHSHSAPIVGDHFMRRRMSLQMSHDKGGDGGRPRLRRTSSMVYVDKGPDIDSPDNKEERVSIQELISDVSDLRLNQTKQPSGHMTAQPSHVTRATERRIYQQAPSKKAIVRETLC